MTHEQSHAVSNQLRRLIGRQSGCTLTDAQLLEEFVTERDEAAFEVLVWRHGTMVLSLCQRVLHDSHEAEDAFQVTFLVFARKAGSIGKRDSVGSWLYKVAYRVALRLRTRKASRSAREEPLDDLPAREATDEVLWHDLRPVLDEEINRLPEKYRAAFVLCYLQGHTNEEAAERLGCPKGTILSRLARGRERLRSRLARRGLALSVGGLATVLSQNAVSAAVPAALVSSTIQAAIPFAAGQAVAGLVSASVASLTEGVLHTMFLTKLKFATAALLALATLGTGVGLFSYQTLAGPANKVEAAAAFQEEQRRPESERRPDERRGEGERQREPRNPPAFNGKITSISEDGKTLTLEFATARGEEPKKTTLKLTDKSTVEFARGQKDIFKKLKVGDTASVWLQAGSTDTVASLQAQRQPNLTGKIVGVSADEKLLTLEVPGRERGAGPDKIEIKLTEKTKKEPGRGEEGKLQVGNLATVWLEEGSKDTAVVVQANRPRPDAAGVITAISPDGKVLTLEAKTRGGEATSSEIKLAETTKIQFLNGQGKKLKVGQTVMVWFQEGSRETAAIVQANLQRRSPDVNGTITAISPDGKVITLEVRKRGEEPTKTEIKLTDKTEIEFPGTEKAEEKKLTVGYSGAVWFQEGSKDTAALFQAAKPAVRSR